MQLVVVTHEALRRRRWGRYGLEEKDFDFSAERVTASVHESLARLGLEYLDVVQAHDVEFGSLDQARGFNRATSHLCQSKCIANACPWKSCSRYAAEGPLIYT